MHAARPSSTIAAAARPASSPRHPPTYSPTLFPGARAAVKTPSRSPCATPTLCCSPWTWAASEAGEDDELLGRPGHRDVAVDRSLDALAERLWVDEDDQVELEPLGQFRGQRPDAGRRRASVFQGRVVQGSVFQGSVFQGSVFQGRGI